MSLIGHDSSRISQIDQNTHKKYPKPKRNPLYLSLPESFSSKYLYNTSGISQTDHNID
jgi:hypothetical protein